MLNELEIYHIEKHKDDIRNSKINIDSDKESREIFFKIFQS